MLLIRCVLNVAAERQNFKLHSRTGLGGLCSLNGGRVSATPGVSHTCSEKNRSECVDNQVKSIPNCSIYKHEMEVNLFFSPLDLELLRENKFRASARFETAVFFNTK